MRLPGHPSARNYDTLRKRKTRDSVNAEVRQLNLALLIYGNLDTLSGGYLYDRKLVAHLRKNGDRVEIISIPWRSYLSHLADNFSAPLLDRLSKLEVDLLLQDELNHPSLFILNRRLRKRVDYPIVSIVHHLRSSEQRTAWGNRVYRWVERNYLASVDGFIFNSQTTRAVVEKLLGAKRPAVVAFPAGDHLPISITESEITQRATKPGPLRLLFLGNLIPRKGLHTLLTALSILPSEAWRLAVVGDLEVDPSYTHTIRRLIKQIDLSNQIELLGSLVESDLISRMENAHILVLPSSYEGFGIAYLEGFGFGLPGIATTNGAAGEIITHGVNGFLIEPDDIDALVGHLATMHADRARLLEFSLSARRSFTTHPTWKDTGTRIRRFLYQMVGE